MRRFYVYMLASKSHRLYVGITNDMARRLFEHRSGQVTHTAKYRINRLVYVEPFDDPRDAIRAEKIIKGWLRRKKINLIEKHNPKWDDLGQRWFEQSPPTADPSPRSG